MFRTILSSILLIVFSIGVGCAEKEPESYVQAFEAEGAPPETTTLIVKRLSDNKIWISNSERANIRFIPASTSKIPHTLIALETKTALPDTLFKWDGKKRAFKSWDQDQTLTTAYRRSAAWVYQDMTRDLGPNIMRSWLTEFDYGNHDIGNNRVDLYWLVGPLKISAMEQVEFLTKLVKRDWPLSSETYDRAWKIFKNETKGMHVLYAKTGWVHDKDIMDIGWFVGWVEVDSSETYVFAMNMDMAETRESKNRKPIVMKALKTIGAWPVSED